MGARTVLPILWAVLLAPVLSIEESPTPTDVEVVAAFRSRTSRDDSNSLPSATENEQAPQGQEQERKAMVRPYRACPHVCST